MDLQEYSEKLKEIKNQLEAGRLDEIPLSARPQTPNIDYDRESYVVVSYSRKDFPEVYLFLEYLRREGYRFWYDNGMQGVDTWLNEFQDKYENPNCLGTITFFSDHYISNSTKGELSVIYQDNQYRKRNMMISLVALNEMDPEKTLISAIVNGRITIENAAVIKPVLTQIIEQEKEKTIHRYKSEEDIPCIAEKLDKLFPIRNVNPAPVTQEKLGDFFVVNGVLRKYVGKDCDDVLIPKSVAKIDEGAFASCMDVVSVVIPETVTEIGAYAFSGCMSLAEVTIANSVESIWDYAFQSCWSLKSVTIPSSVTLIGDGAFCECSELESVTLEDGVFDIYHEAFYGCAALKSITIPKSVGFIGNAAFYGCDALEYLVYEGTKEQWKRIDLGDIGVSRVKCIDGEIEVY